MLNRKGHKARKEFFYEFFAFSAVVFLFDYFAMISLAKLRTLAATGRMA
jgi:hypothetical protein